MQFEEKETESKGDDDKSNDNSDDDKEEEEEYEDEGLDEKEFNYPENNGIFLSKSMPSDNSNTHDSTSID